MSSHGRVIGLAGKERIRMATIYKKKYPIPMPEGAEIITRRGRKPARNGVSPSMAQKLMRHSDIRLTMNLYTHVDLADAAATVAALPIF